MIYEFEAQAIQIEVNHFYSFSNDVTVGFGELNEKGKLKTYLVLRRFAKDGDFDDGYYVEWCKKKNSAYNCIDLFEFSQNKARILFKKEVKFAKEIIITFEIDDEHFQDITKCLRDIIFRNSNYFSIK